MVQDTQNLLVLHRHSALGGKWKWLSLIRSVYSQLITEASWCYCCWSNLGVGWGESELILSVFLVMAATDMSFKQVAQWGLKRIGIRHVETDANFLLLLLMFWKEQCAILSSLVSILDMESPFWCQYMRSFPEVNCLNWAVQATPNSTPLSGSVLSLKGGNP